MPEHDDECTYHVLRVPFRGVTEYVSLRDLDQRAVPSLVELLAAGLSTRRR